MKNKLGMTRIASMMSQATGRPKNLCEDFLRELFSICADALEEGDSVRIKGFGTFKLAMVEARKSVDVSTGEDIVIEPYRKVLFVASRELAAAVNSPFEMFQTVELAENDTAVEDPEENPEEEAEKILTEAEKQVEAEADNLAKAEKEAEIVSVLRSEEVTPAPDNSDSSDNSDIPDSPDNSDIPDSSDNSSSPRGFRFGWGFFAGFISAIVAGAAAFMIYQKVSSDMASPENVDIQAAEREMAVADSLATLRKTASPEISDSLGNVSAMISGDASGDATDAGEADMTETAKKPDTAPSDTPVYDVVTTTRYLTTIASEHYGNFNLWPYIYEENKAILGHPDRIKPGTRIVVPPLSKYGVNPKNKSDIDKAKKMGKEIYSRYRK